MHILNITIWYNYLEASVKNTTLIVVCSSNYILSIFSLRSLTSYYITTLQHLMDLESTTVILYWEKQV